MAAKGKAKAPAKARDRKPPKGAGDLERLSGRLEALSSELREVKKSVVPRAKVREIEGDLYREIRSLKGELRDLSRQVSGNAERAGSSLASVQKELAELRKLEEHVKRVDVMGVRRDIESLGARHKWLENRMDSINLDGIIEKITELEALIEGVKAASPIVIE